VNRFLKSLLLSLCAAPILAVCFPQRAVLSDVEPVSKRDPAPIREVYTGTAVAIGGALGGASRGFTLEITSYTPPEEVQQDLETLRTQGQDGLYKAIEKKKLGNFAFTGDVGRDVNFVTQTDMEEGRKITILFERWLKFFELRRGTRSVDYPFTYVELFMEGRKGEGSLIGAAKVYLDKKHPSTLDVENFGTYPARLMGVELRR